MLKFPLYLSVLLTVITLTMACGGGGGGSGTNTESLNNEKPFSILHQYWPDLQPGENFEAVKLSDGRDAAKYSTEGTEISLYYIQPDGENGGIFLGKSDLRSVSQEYVIPSIFIPAVNDITKGYKWNNDDSDGGRISTSGYIHTDGKAIPGVNPPREFEIVYMNATNPNTNENGYVIYRTSQSGDWDGIDYFYDHSRKSGLSFDWNLNSVQYPYAETEFTTAFPQ